MRSSRPNLILQKRSPLGVISKTVLALVFKAGDFWRLVQWLRWRLRQIDISQKFEAAPNAFDQRFTVGRFLRIQVGFDIFGFGHGALEWDKGTFLPNSMSVCEYVGIYFCFQKSSAAQPCLKRPATP